MDLRGRLRDWVACAEAVVFGVLAGVAGWVGPWPWLALPASLLTTVAVFFIGSRAAERRDDDILATEAARHILRWTRAVPDDSPVRTDADEAFTLATDFEIRVRELERKISRMEDGSEKVAAEDELRKSMAHVTSDVTEYLSTDSVPERPSDWYGLTERLRTACRWLEAEQGSPPIANQ